MRIDLHVHSHASDGHLAPAAVVAAAAAGGLHVLALADHDTVAGVAEAQAAGPAAGVRVISAIEVTARHGAAEVHVLGYHVDPAAAALRDHEARSAHRRTDRMRRMVERLNEQGVPVTWDEVIRAAGPEAASLGRPHLARALMAAGHVRSFSEAFDRWLRDGGSAFVDTQFPSVEEAIALIHDAGGLAVWAHPPLDAFDGCIRPFAEWGLDGVEVWRPATLPADAQRMLAATRALGLFPTGGSDWHGPHRGPLGDFHVREEWVREVLDARPWSPRPTRAG